MNISILDWAIVVIYLLGVVSIGCWAGINAKKKGQQHGESVAGDYFMAAHTLKWPVIGLALFATNIAFPLATGWLILHDIFGIEKWTCIIMMCTLTGIYTVAGGLAAVAITETIQTVILLIGACVITWFA